MPLIDGTYTILNCDKVSLNQMKSSTDSLDYVIAQIKPVRLQISDLQNA